MPLCWRFHACVAVPLEDHRFYFWSRVGRDRGRGIGRGGGFDVGARNLRKNCEISRTIVLSNPSIAIPRSGEKSCAGNGLMPSRAKWAPFCCWPRFVLRWPCFASGDASISDRPPARCPEDCSNNGNNSPRCGRGVHICHERTHDRELNRPRKS
jgi:hypothetical protein